jgi:hypothetical protein
MPRLAAAQDLRPVRNCEGSASLLASGSKDTRVSTGIVNSAGVLGRGSEAEGFALREQARGPPFVVALIFHLTI